MAQHQHTGGISSSSSLSSGALAMPVAAPHRQQHQQQQQHRSTRSRRDHQQLPFSSTPYSRSPPIQFISPTAPTGPAPSRDSPLPTVTTTMPSSPPPPNRHSAVTGNSSSSNSNSMASPVIAPAVSTASTNASTTNSSTSLTMPRVVHYLHSEWRRYETDRADWARERAELQERIKSIQSALDERTTEAEFAQRRMRMLESALIEERQLRGTSSSNSLDMASAAINTSVSTAGQHDTPASSITGDRATGSDSDTLSSEEVKVSPKCIVESKSTLTLMSPPPSSPLQLSDDGRDMQPDTPSETSAMPAMPAMERLSLDEDTAAKVTLTAQPNPAPSTAMNIGGTTLKTSLSSTSSSSNSSGGSSGGGSSNSNGSGNGLNAINGWRARKRAASSKPSTTPSTPSTSSNFVSNFFQAVKRSPFVSGITGTSTARSVSGGGSTAIGRIPSRPAAVASTTTAITANRTPSNDTGSSTGNSSVNGSALAKLASNKIDEKESRRHLAKRRAESLNDSPSAEFEIVQRPVPNSNSPLSQRRDSRRIRRPAAVAASLSSQPTTSTTPSVANGSVVPFGSLVASSGATTSSVAARSPFQFGRNSNTTIVSMNTVLSGTFSPTPITAPPPPPPPVPPPVPPRPSIESDLNDAENEAMRFSSSSELVPFAPFGGRLSLTGHLEAVRTLSWHPTEPVLASGSDDGQVMLWDIASLAIQQLQHPPPSQQEQAKSRPGSKSSAASLALEPLTILHAHDGPVTSMSTLSDVLLTGGIDGSLKVWQLPFANNPLFNDDGKHLPKQVRMRRSLYSMRGTGIDEFASATCRSGGPIWSILSLGEASESGTRAVATAESNGVGIWSIPSMADTSEWQLTSDHFDLGDSIADLCVVADGRNTICVARAIASALNPPLAVVDWTTKSIVRSFGATDGDGTSRVLRLASRSGSPLVAAAFTDHTVRLFDLRSSATSASVLAKLELNASALSVDPSGSLLAVASTGGDSTVSIWDMRSLNTLQTSIPQYASRGKNTPALCTSFHSRAFDPVVVGMYSPTPTRYQLQQTPSPLPSPLPFANTSSAATLPLFASGGTDGIVHIYSPSLTSISTRSPTIPFGATPATSPAASPHPTIDSRFTTSSPH
ncbi:WD40 repeat-like protein [Ramicandelaber brevisporus]|nr:WD40 repeat-like protein [Ramicandelaber brevisporus]